MCVTGFTGQSACANKINFAVDEENLASVIKRVQKIFFLPIIL